MQIQSVWEKDLQGYLYIIVLKFLSIDLIKLIYFKLHANECHEIRYIYYVESDLSIALITN